MSDLAKKKCIPCSGDVPALKDDEITKLKKELKNWEIKKTIDGYNCLNKNIKFSLVNRLLTKKHVSEVIDTIFRYCGQKETVIFCDRIKDLGFKHAFKAGISFGKNDLIIPKTKEKLVNQTKKQIEDYEKQYQDGLITRGEKYNKVVDIWSKCTDSVANEMMKGISATETNKDGIKINSVFMMADSGARGSAAQMKQLAGMRGLIAKPSGEIIETPIISNFKEGLTEGDFVLAAKIDVIN